MGAAVNPAVNPRQPAQGLLSLCKIWDYRLARVPLGPDYSCSLSPGLGVLLAKPRFCVCFLVPCTAGWFLGMGCSQFRFLSAEHLAGASPSIDAWLGACPGRKALRREICAPCAGERPDPAPWVCVLPNIWEPSTTGISARHAMGPNRVAGPHELQVVSFCWACMEMVLEMRLRTILRLDQPHGCPASFAGSLHHTRR